MTYPLSTFTEVWETVRQRLVQDPALRRLLYGSGHIYLEGEDYGTPEGAETSPWCRLVIAPATSLWPQGDAPGVFNPVAFLVRAECNRFSAQGYNPQLALEGLQIRVQVLLGGWYPAPASMGQTKIALPIYYQRTIEPRLMWDEVRRLHFMSVEYRTEVTTS